MRVPILAAVLLLAPGTAFGQSQPAAGPVIRSAGAVFDVPHADFATPLDQDYLLAFEMADAAASPDRPNVVLNSVARYLNMHARAGVPRGRVQAAVVVHGPAGWEMLGHGAYRERHGVDNPNARLIEELTQAGVRIILCGQTAAARGIPTDGLMEEVQVALSAMTAFLVLQEEGYRVNPW